ncbi:hypothetical protein ACSSS7_000508 [Eimeria intestinalis]
MVPPSNRRPFRGVLAAVVSVLLLAMVTKKQLEAFQTPRVGATGPQRAREEELSQALGKPEKDPTDPLGLLKEGPQTTPERPKVEPPRLPRVPKAAPEKAAEEHKAEVLPPEFQQAIVSLVDWAKQVPVPKTEILRLPDLEDNKFEVVLLKDGLRYIIRAYFMKLTPAYDSEKTAALLSEGATELLEGCLREEDNVHTRGVYHTPTAVLGDIRGGQIYVVIACLLVEKSGRSLNCYHDGVGSSTRRGGG